MSEIYQPDSYKVASNPVLGDAGQLPLHVMFAGESQTKPAHRLGPKVYDFYLMHIVLSGRGYFTLDGVRQELHAGHTFLIEPEQLISYESHAGQPWRYRWAAFGGAQAPLLVREAGFRAGNRQVIHMNDINKAGKLYSRIFESFRSGRPSASLSASGCMHLLLSEYKEAFLTSYPHEPAAKLREEEKLHLQVAHYLSSQYTHPVSIEAMAETLGYNRAYLSRLFKRHTGISPVAFLLKLRIDKARQMLRERPELTIEQISASVGLQDSLYFSKQFRRFYGMSPTAYRVQMLQKQD